MSNESSYDAIIFKYCSSPKNRLEDCLKNSGSRFSRAFVLSIMGKFPEYQVVSCEIEQEQMNEVNRLYFLEAKIHFLSKRNPRFIFSKERNTIQNDFKALCYEALSIYPYAFFASKNLARNFEVQRRYKDAFNHLTKIWDHGFQCSTIYDSLVFISITTKDWGNARKLLENQTATKYQLFLKSYFFGMKYRMFDVLFSIVLLITLLIEPWLVFLEILGTILLIPLGLSYYFNSRVIFVMAISRIVELIMIGLVKLIILQLH